MNHPDQNRPGYPFVWRRHSDSPAPLNANARKTAAPKVGGTPRQDVGFGANHGTITGLSKAADRLLTKGHGGAYSKVVPQ